MCSRFFVFISVGKYLLPHREINVVLYIILVFIYFKKLLLFVRLKIAISSLSAFISKTVHITDIKQVYVFYVKRAQKVENDLRNKKKSAENFFTTH